MVPRPAAKQVVQRTGLAINKIIDRLAIVPLASWLTSHARHFFLIPAYGSLLKKLTHIHAYNWIPVYIQNVLFTMFTIVK